MRVLITAGPTREPIDDVRFISNRSSGRMGIALAEEAIARKHMVTLILGPTDVKPPKRARAIRVETADEMRRAVLDEMSKSRYDVFISSAAVADYTVKKASGKIKSGRERVIQLKPTRKIVDEVKKKHPATFVVGFKAEHSLSGSGLLNSAKKKLAKANLDLIVANDVSKPAFGGNENEVWVIDKAGKVTKTGRKSKRTIAKNIWDVISNALCSAS